MEEKDRRRDLSSNQEKSPKVIQAGEQWDGQPYVYVGERCIVLAGQLGKGIIIDGNYGTTIQGPISLSEMPEYVSFGGGFWRVNPAVLASIGSSAAMNVPWLVHDEPELLKTRFDLAEMFNGFGVL